MAGMARHHLCGDAPAIPERLWQDGLLIGPERIIRADALAGEEKIAMDDWTQASAELLGGGGGCGFCRSAVHSWGSYSTADGR